MDLIGEIDRVVAAKKFSPADWESPAALELLAAWARMGAKLSEIAQWMGIRYTDLLRWKNTSPLIEEALNTGYEKATAQVEAALFKRAVGYEYTEVKYESGSTGQGLVDKTTETVKQVAPDVTAQQFWLKNVAPDRWRDRKDVSVGVHIQEQQAAQLLEVMDTALSGLGLTAAQRARLPELVRSSLVAKGLVQEAIEA
jgi:hypothetical protein